MTWLSSLRADSLTRTAMLCAALMMAHQVAGKATRDALFLTAFPIRDLPRMVIAAAVLSLILGFLFSRILGRYGPRRVIPAAFALSSLLQFVAWSLITTAPRFVAVAMYLHIVAFSAVLLSGFWSLASEVFDPTTAKHRFGRITGAGTAGGILGGLLAERVAFLFGQNNALLLLAACHALAACGMLLLRAEPGAVHHSEQPPVPAAEVFRRAPYLRNLAFLVLLGTASTAILDYLFKSGATDTFGKGAPLLRFFALYYASTSVLTLLSQTLLTRPALVHLGLGKTVATLPAVVGLGGLTALTFPVFPTFALTRALENILRGSLFRSGYELFYTPVPAAEKRSAKTLIDVGCDRMGDAVGAGVVQSFLFLAPQLVRSEILGVTVVFAAAAVWIALRLDHAYSFNIERGLLNRAEELDFTSIEDSIMMSAVLQTREYASVAKLPPPRPAPPPAPHHVGDEVSERLHALRSGDHAAVSAELSRMPPVDRLLAAQVIRLLAWNEVTAKAREILVSAHEAITGQLIDFLLDQEEDFAVRRRIPRVLAYCPTQRALNGLVEGLNDPRFEVRFHCGRALDALHLRNPDLAYPAEAIFAVVERELSVSRNIWESRRLLDAREPTDAYSYLDDHLKERADQSLEYIFSLLATIVPRDPLKVAFRALHTDDRLLRGLAREYLESALPGSLREKLWAVVDAGPPPSVKTSPEEVLKRLLGSSESLIMKIQEQRPPPSPPQQA